ncbi:MFS transporter [Paenibacillus abyssi]|uniref:MFS transporter n=1 Tax=Paenibacillus abyssi TaxID=1340531 RepID=A0A917FUJ4_9BACL|nr:MFS transporter [Paenibacillus abyssi]GGG06615.1 MFS transporter [Paenibacillus abyssi]
MKNNTQSHVQYVICLGAFISTLTAGMFNITLVDIAADYGQSIQSVQWIVTGYLLAVSTCLPLMGRLGDIKGKRLIHNSGILLFMLGSLCCALSTNLGSLIAFRVLQGIGASMYQATNMALVVSLFPPERRGSALGLTGTFVAAGSMIGPSLGGIFLQWFSWQMNFWFLTVFSLIAWLLAQAFIPKDQPAGSSRLDWMGAALFGASLTGLITGLNLGSVWGWGSLAVLLLFALFTVCLAGFILWSVSRRWDRIGHTPFIQLGIFGQQRVRLGMGTTLITNMAAFSAQLVLPVYLLSVLHLQPALVGLILLSYPATLIIAAPLSGRLSDRLGSMPIIYAGLTCMVASLSALSFLSANSTVLYVIVFTVLLGSSMGMVNSPNNSLTMGSVPKHYLGLIGSMIALSRNMGMIFGTVAAGALVVLSPGDPSSSYMLTEEKVSSGFGAVFALAAILVAVMYAVHLFSAFQHKRRALAAHQISR